jgi:hypothetical protein
MHKLLFRFEPVDEELSLNDVQVKFNHVIYNWARSGQDDKLKDIFGRNISVSPPIVSLGGMNFEVVLSRSDDGWTLNPISSEDLAIAMGLDPVEWTIWRKLASS